MIKKTLIFFWLFRIEILSCWRFFGFEWRWRSLEGYIFWVVRRFFCCRGVNLEVEWLRGLYVIGELRVCLMYLRLGFFRNRFRVKYFCVSDLLRKGFLERLVSNDGK